MRVTHLLVGLTAICAAMVLPAHSACAQTYPTKPVRVIFPIAAGSSSNDILGRALTQRLAATLGQQIVVDNRPGTGGGIGSELAAKSAADGYTLLLGYTGALAIAPSVYEKVGFDPVRDFAPVARFALIPYAMIVNPAVSAASVKQLIALARARPGQLNFASSGNGSLPHLAGELFKLAANIDLVHVPYKAGAPAVTDLLGGQVQLYFTGITSVVPFLKVGKLRAIAVTTLVRSPLLPDVSTASESGLPGFDVASWLGILAPAGTPVPIVSRLHAEIARICNAADMKNFILSQGSEPALQDPAQFGGYLKTEIAKWSKVVKSANVKAD